MTEPTARNVHELFGDVLPGQTRDELAREYEERSDEAERRDEELKREVPPHH